MADSASKKPRREVPWLEDPLKRRDGEVMPGQRAGRECKRESGAAAARTRIGIKGGAMCSEG